MRELVASFLMQKLIIALVDPEVSHGGLSLEEVRTRLLNADQLYSKWAFNQGEDGVRGEALHSHLFKHKPIEWNRIGHFQDVRTRPLPT